MSISEFLVLVSIQYRDMFRQVTNLEIGLGIWFHSSPYQQTTSDKDESIYNHLIFGRISLEASGEDIIVLGILAYRQIV